MPWRHLRNWLNFPQICWKTKDVNPYFEDSISTSCYSRRNLGNCFLGICFTVLMLQAQRGHYSHSQGGSSGLFKLATDLGVMWCWLTGHGDCKGWGSKRSLTQISKEGLRNHTIFPWEGSVWKSESGSKMQRTITGVRESRNVQCLAWPGLTCFGPIPFCGPISHFWAGNVCPCLVYVETILLPFLLLLCVTAKILALNLRWNWIFNNPGTAQNLLTVRWAKHHWCKEVDKSLWWLGARCKDFASVCLWRWNLW